MRIRARGRTAGRKTGMNKTEAFHAIVLEARKRNGEIHDYRYEGMTLRLADRTTYTPDFLVIMPGGEIELHETKGFWRDDARVKIKVAAEAFPWFVFRSFVFEQKHGQFFMKKEEEF